MRAFVVCLVAIVVVGCGARANLKLTRVTRTQGADVTTTTIAYDGAHAQTITSSTGKTLALTFDGNKLRKLDTTSTNAGNSRTDFLYDGDRLVRAATDLANGGGSTTDDVTYDDKGRVAAIDEHSETTLFHGDTHTKLVHDNDGLHAIEKAGATFTFSRTNGVLSGSTITDADGTRTSTIAVQDGKIDREDVVLADGTHASLAYSYDDNGRMARVIETEDGAEDVVIALDYDEGEAADLDMEPVEISLFFLWDLSGALFDDIDAHTDVARFLGVSL